MVYTKRNRDVGERGRRTAIVRITMAWPDAGRRDLYRLAVQTRKHIDSLGAGVSHEQLVQFVPTRSGPDNY
eukprot:44212-Lingulodinium_polyedra.AAC.1